MLSYVCPNQTKGVSDSDSIQRAVRLAAENGTRCVLIPKYNERTGENVWNIDQTVRLPSDMTIILDDCLLVLEDDVYSGFFCSENLLTESGTRLSARMHSISIIGRGNATLDGGKANDLSEKTEKRLGIPIVVNSPIVLLNVEGFEVSSLSIINQRYWGMRFEYCSNGSVRNIFFNVKRDRFNQDGINLRNGCHDIVIEDIRGQTGDDMIALSAIDTEELCPALIVRGHDSDIHDVLIRNVSGAAIRHPLVALRNHNGAKMYNITIDGIRDTEKIAPVEADDFERYALITLGVNSYALKSPAAPGDTYGISISNVEAFHSVRAIRIQSVLSDSTIRNVRAGGVCRSVISTGPDGWAKAPSGAVIDGLSLSDVNFRPSDASRAALLDFGIMREGDWGRDFVIASVELDQTIPLCRLDECVRDFECHLDGILLETIERVPHREKMATPLEAPYWRVNGKATHESEM